MTTDEIEHVKELVKAAREKANQVMDDGTGSSHEQDLARAVYFLTSAIFRLIPEQSGR